MHVTPFSKNLDMQKPVTSKYPGVFAISRSILIYCRDGGEGGGVNDPLFMQKVNSFEVIFPLSMISNCKPCKSSFVLTTAKEALSLSFCIIKLEMTTLLPVKGLLINFFRSSNLPSTSLNGSLTVLFLPIYNIMLSVNFFNSGLI